MIQMDKGELMGYGGGDIDRLLLRVRPVLEHREKMYGRYIRKGDSPIPMHTGSGGGNKRVAVPFEYYIVNIVQGYLAGKAPVYSVQHKTAKSGSASNAGKYNDTIEQIRRYNDDAATYIELMHDYLTTSAAYLYIYENEANEVVYTRFDSRQTVAVFDYSTPPNIIGCVRVWEKEDMGARRQIAELITEKDRRIFTQGKDGFLEGSPECLSWNDVPVVAIENPDQIAVFEPALAEIEAYEDNLGNVRNMTRYNDDAKLLLKGFSFENALTIEDDEGRLLPNPKRAAEEKRILEAIALCVGEDGDISWLIKNINYAGIMETLKQYHDLITMLTGVPNMTDEAFSNANNASALGYKLYALDQYSATTDRMFRKGYLRLWEIITNRLNLKGESFDFRDIDILMQRNIPTDKDKSIDRAARMKSSGIFSDETCINESQVEVDPREEATRIEMEQEEDFKKMQERAKYMGAQEPPDSNVSEGAGQDIAPVNEYTGTKGKGANP